MVNNIHDTSRGSQHGDHDAKGVLIVEFLEKCDIWHLTIMRDICIRFKVDRAHMRKSYVAGTISSTDVQIDRKMNPTIPSSTLREW